MGSNQPVSTSEVAGSARGWAGSLRGQLRDAGPAGAAIASALDAVATTFDAVMDAKAKAAMIVSDPMLATDFKVNKARQTVGDAVKAATAAAQALQGALEQGRTKLAGAILPGKPAAFDATLAAFQASEIVKILEGAGGSGTDVAKKAAGVLADALASGDRLTAYIVTNMLGVTYDRLGANGAVLYELFAKALDDAGEANTGTGASLLPYLRQGGSGTLAGLAVAAAYAAFGEQKAFDTWLAGQLRYSLIQNGPGNTPMR